MTRIAAWCQKELLTGRWNKVLSHIIHYLAYSSASSSILRQILNLFILNIIMMIAWDSLSFSLTLYTHTRPTTHMTREIEWISLRTRRSLGWVFSSVSVERDPGEWSVFGWSDSFVIKVQGEIGWKNSRWARKWIEANGIVDNQHAYKL